MAKICGIGACVSDLLLSLPAYPTEDTKVCAENVRTCGGGPVATGLCAAAKLGVSAAFIGDLAGDDAGVFLKNDFLSRNVAVPFVNLIPDTRSFRSVLWLCADKGSRTCVFDRGNVPERPLTEEEKALIAEAEILMVDGNRLEMALEGAKIAKENGTRVLYDCGGLYEGVEKLLALTDIMIPSEEFALGATGCDSPRRAAEALYKTYSPEIVVVTQGKRGGLLYDGLGTYGYPIYPAKVVDSNGAGDVFHGAFAAGTIFGLSPLRCCHFSSAVSALKCTGIGARDSVPDFETVREFLKVNGFEL